MLRMILGYRGERVRTCDFCCEILRVQVENCERLNLCVPLVLTLLVIHIVSYDMLHVYLGNLWVLCNIRGEREGGRPFTRRDQSHGSELGFSRH